MVWKRRLNKDYVKHDVSRDIYRAICSNTGYYRIEVIAEAITASGIAKPRSKANAAKR